MASFSSMPSALMESLDKPDPLGWGSIKTGGGYALSTGPIDSSPPHGSGADWLSDYDPLFDLFEEEMMQINGQTGMSSGSALGFDYLSEYDLNNYYNNPYAKQQDELSLILGPDWMPCPLELSSPSPGSSSAPSPATSTSCGLTSSTAHATSNHNNPNNNTSNNTSSSTTTATITLNQTNTTIIIPTQHIGNTTKIDQQSCTSTLQQRHHYSSGSSIGSPIACASSSLYTSSTTISRSSSVLNNGCLNLNALKNHKRKCLGRSRSSAGTSLLAPPSTKPNCGSSIRASDNFVRYCVRLEHAYSLPSTASGTARSPT